MAEIRCQIDIQATPIAVFQAITTQNGLCGWWTNDSVAEPKLGSIAQFGFSNRQTLFRMKIVEFMPVKRVVWECLGDVDEWIGTRITWDIARENTDSRVSFTHSGWRSTEGWYETCKLTWGQLMYQLKDYAEGKNPGPYFKGFLVDI